MQSELALNMHESAVYRLKLTKYRDHPPRHRFNRLITPIKTIVVSAINIILIVRLELVWVCNFTTPLSNPV
jgi:hypothetical protein